MRPRLKGLRLIAILSVCAATTACTAGADDGVWQIQASATSGVAVFHQNAKGREDLRLACRRNPDDLLVVSERVGPGVASTLEVGKAHFPLTGGPDGLTGTAETARRLAAALPAAPVVLVQGDRMVGPFAPPPAEIADAFAKGCGI